MPLVVYILMEDLIENRELICNYIYRSYSTCKTKKRLSHALKSATFISDTELTKAIAQFGRSANIELTNVAERWFSLCEKRFEDYLLQLNGCNYAHRLYSTFPDRMVAQEETGSTLRKDGAKLILSTLGPGDEIACSAAYSALLKDKNINHKEISIVCDRRFLSIFQRSYPEFKFIPTERKRYLDYGDYHIVRHLPTTTVHSILCSNAFQTAKKYPHWITMMQLAGYYRSYMLGTENSMHIHADPELTRHFSKQLRYPGKLVGITWRGAIATTSRMLNYLKLEELEELFSVEGVTFVNLQYGDTDRETAWINKHFPGKLVTLKGLDVYNDFESLLAVIANLDLCIGPATFNANFSAFAGCRTLFVAPTLGASARIMPDGSDLWNRNLIHVGGGENHSRKLLVENLVKALRREIQT